MFDFSTVTPQVLAVITAAMDLIDPTTLFGGIVTVALVGTLMVKLISRVRSLAR